MIQSAKPRKQRLFRFTAPMHDRQHFLHSHLDKKLKEKLQLKRRAIQISRGDSVKVMSGAHRGKEGKVLRVSLRSGRIAIDTVTRKNAKGKEISVPIYASNVYITDLNLTDKVRAAKLNVKAVAPVKTEKKPEPAQAAPKVSEEKIKAEADRLQKEINRQMSKE